MLFIQLLKGINALGKKKEKMVQERLELMGYSIKCDSQEASLRYNT